MKSFSCHLRRLCAAFTAGLLVFAGAAAVAHAETIIDNGTLVGNVTWNESGSPYYVSDPVTIPSGSSLTINPGVTVVGSDAIQGNSLFWVQGKLTIDGTPDKRVTLSGAGSVTILSDEATTSIENTDVSVADGVSVFGSSLDMASSTITGASEALYIRSGSVSITGSQIKNNGAGVFIEPSVQSVISPMAVGIGDLSAAPPPEPPASVSITDSDITDNQGAAIENQDTSVVTATDDWWGSDAGPSLDGSNDLVGSVEYEPWQKHASTTVCCSSVLFIPGIEASRIYSPIANPLNLGTTTVMAWEPLSNPTVKSMYLNPDGSSINPNVYSGDAIDKAYGLFDVYGTFMKFMNGLVADGTIGSWKAFGYDWRKPIAEVVAGREKKATTTESLLDTVMALASTSKTGKVTLIAHSNGGLVTKYLVKTLADMGKADLIDKVISVAVPYLGTPLAIPALLYGDSESFAYGILLKQSVAQKLGENMSSAYSLLPSTEYFAQGLGPTIAYASGTSSPINNSSEQDSLISSKANEVLMAAAESLHAIIDPFEWPEAIQRWALVGWGNDTIQSTVYSKTGSDKHTASTTLLGDGTVVVGSAAFNDGTTTALDLPVISKQESSQYSHQNILDASSTDAAIADIIEGKASSDSLTQIPGVSIGMPDPGSASRIVVSTHSPVDLHVYDQYGNHTGIIPAPVGSGVADDVVSFYEAKIPGSSFEQNGGDGTDDDTDTEISLPTDSGQIYSIQIQGNGTGEFTYEAERFNGDNLLSDTIYSGLPTTPLTIASTTIDSNANTSSSALLSVDVDGDGTTDIVAKPNENLDPTNFFEVLKKVIISLLGSKNKRANEFSNRINKIEDAFGKDKTKRVVNKLSQLETAIGHKQFKNLTQNDKDEIVHMIDEFLKNYEN